MVVEPIILLAAGGTGGHIFPAQAVAEELRGRGFCVHFVTDARGQSYYGADNEAMMHLVSAGTIFGGKWWRKPFKLVSLLIGIIQALILGRRLRPTVIIGFGGYPSFAPCFAGLLMRRVVLVHEQNAVLGRANKWLVRLGAHLATNYTSTLGVWSRAVARIHQTGNPVRRTVQECVGVGYQISPETDFNLLVFGGSQGAKIFSTVVPKAVSMLPTSIRTAIHIVHQSHNAQMRSIMAAYCEAGISAEIRDFFDDLPERMRRAHLVISRAGASTIAELIVMGTPSILVPLPGAIDQDQMCNARSLAQKQATIAMRQEHFTPARLSATLEGLCVDRARLQKMSQSVSLFRQKDATVRLANYASCLVAGVPINLDNGVNINTELNFDGRVASNETGQGVQVP